MKTLKYFLLPALIAMIFGSCKKDVDLFPTDVILAQNAFRTVTDLNQGALGTYGTWLARRPIYVSAVISDEARQGSGAEYRGVGAILFRFEQTSDAQDFRDAENGGIWTNMYAVIDRANRVIEAADTMNLPNAADVSTRDRIKGEMLAVRAFAHLELLRNYARSYDPTAPGIPYQSTFVKPSEVATYRPSRTPSGTVIANIEADLAQARTLIPASFTDISRVTRNAVVAMQARTAIYSRNWDSAAARATFVINAQPLTPRASYAAIWTTRNLPANQSTEVIWKLNVAQANIGAAVGSLFQDANGAQQFAPSNKLLNSYDQANDIRFATFYRTTPRPLLAKYGVIAPGVTDNFVYDIKMLRTSEMYLIRAEARAELNDLTGAAADINALRAQRILNYTPVTYSSKAEAIEDIYLERYRELAFEGHRYYDLKRRNLPIERLLEDVQGNAAIATLQPTNPRYLLPIPQQEIFANPNLEQNPGY
jgi:starch-binding outer membrane protein, SusD/RagB family